MIVGLETENSIKVSEYFRKSEHRLKKMNLTTWKMRLFPKKESYLILSKNTKQYAIRPIYALIPVLGAYILFPSLWWLIPALIFLFFEFLISRYFNFIVMYQGLRKEGYIGKIKYVTYKKILEGWFI